MALPAFSAAPPDTAIDSGPMGDSVITSPQFAFSATDAAGFQCSLDGEPFSACTSPVTLRDLALGAHTFSVQAVDSDGQVDPSPASRSWNVVTSPQEAVTVSLTTPRKLSLRKSSLRRIAGTATSATEIKRVQLALTFGDSDKNFFPPRCWFVDLRSGSLVRQTCVLPPYITVTGSSNWQFTVPRAFRRKVPAGRYVLLVRTVNVYGATFSKKIRLTIR